MNYSCSGSLLQQSFSRLLGSRQEGFCQVSLITAIIGAILSGVDNVLLLISRANKLGPWLSLVCLLCVRVLQWAWETVVKLTNIKMLPKGGPSIVFSVCRYIALDNDGTDNGPFKTGETVTLILGRFPCKLHTILSLAHVSECKCSMTVGRDEWVRPLSV